MIIYKCDGEECKIVQSDPFDIEVKGYYPSSAPQILLPTRMRNLQFCSQKCLLEWMKWALRVETSEK